MNWLTNWIRPDHRALAPSATFISGARHRGRIGHYINCSKNPYDLRPAADIITGAAAKMRENMPEGQPLVILMGEFHAMPAHVGLQQLVAARLLDRSENFTVNIEWPHNRWSFLAQYGMHKDVPAGLYYRPNDYDPQGQSALSAFLAFDGLAVAPVSHDNIMAFCLDKTIPTAFNDAANLGGVLDLKDPSTASAAEGYNLSSIPDCMAVRNTVMAQRGVEQAKSLGANIIVQVAGLAHLFGSARDDCSYEKSLSVAYREAGAAVLPVFVTTESQNYGLNVLPEEAYGTLPQSVVIDGLSGSGFTGYKSPAERVFLKEILGTNSGGEIAFYDVEAHKREYAAVARAEADQILQRYETSPAAPKSSFEP